MPRPLLLAGLALAALPAAACGGSGPPTPLTASLAAGSAPHTLTVTLRSGEAVQVQALQLRGGGFVQVPPTPEDPAVEVRSATSLPLPYGEVLCEGRPAPVAVLVTTPAGVTTVDVPGETPLAALRSEQCAGAEGTPPTEPPAATAPAGG